MFDGVLKSGQGMPFITRDQNRWNPKSAIMVDISRDFGFSFVTFIKGFENMFVRPQWNEFVMENGIQDS